VANRPASDGARQLALLRQALVNLLSNAVKFTGARAHAKIEIGCSPGNDTEAIILMAALT
jgi:signal transduction histidine kinase